MIATISGQAGFAVLPDGALATAYSMDDPASPMTIVAANMDALFRGATDVVSVNVANHDAAVSVLKTEWSRDRLLQMLILLLRADASPGVRELAARAAEELFANRAARRFALNRFYSHPLTDDADASTAVAAATGVRARRTSSALIALQGDQPEIARVAAEWRTILAVVPERNRHGRLRRALEERDVFYRLGRARKPSEISAFQEELSATYLPPPFADVVQHLADARRRTMPPERQPGRISHESGLEPEKVLLANLGLVERQVAMYARRYRIPRYEVEDLASTVKLALVQDDYAVLRKFAGRSSLATYLSIVVKRLVLHDLDRRWGRWEPSAKAARMGEDAMEFERLVWRDGCSVEEACRIVATAWPDVPAPRIEALYDLIPKRVAKPLLVSMPDDLVDVRSLAYDPLAADDVHTFLETALERLPKAEREILRMRFWQGMRVVEIADVLGVRLRVAYKRIESILRTLRRYLEEQGVHPEEVNAFLRRGEPKNPFTFRVAESMYESRK